MPDFIPVLIVAVLLFVSLFVTFGGIITSTDTAKNITYQPLIKNIPLAKNFTVSYTAGEQNVAFIEGRISRGLIIKENKELSFRVPDYNIAKGGKIDLFINRTNLYGPLNVLINGELVYSGYPRPGEHIINFDYSNFREDSTISFIAGSSGWRFWAPTVYEFNSTFYTNYMGSKKRTVYFDLLDYDYTGLTKGYVNLDITSREGTGDILVYINNFEVYRGIGQDRILVTKGMFMEGSNKVEITTESNAIYNINSASIDIIY